jgi:uncharacterized membrane protein YgdD (TMEM256/DUF423 family)
LKTLAILFGLSGFLAVLLGAFGAHALKEVLSQNSLATWQTAVDYHFYHTLAIGLSLLFARQHFNLWLWRAALCFLFGILLFCGSLYLIALTGVNKLGMITPFGGLLFIFGWLAIAFGLKASDDQSPP